jgi:hypothetical protein
MSTYDRPSLVQQMEKHSEALWVLLGDAHGVIRGVPIYEDVPYRELVVRGFLVPTVTYTTEGQWEYRPSREEAEARADDELARRAMGNLVQGCVMYPKPLGEFSPRRRIVFEDAEIHRMFGQVAA